MKAAALFESFFHLRERPFSAAPNVDSYFPGRSIENARQTLVRCIDRNEGVGLIAGSSGIGKSLLCQVLAKQLVDERNVVSIAAGVIEDRPSILQSILHGLNLPYRGLGVVEMWLSLVDHFSQKNKDKRGLLLIVDDAHQTSVAGFQALHQLVSQTFRSGQAINLIISGNETLDEILADPKLSGLQQLIVARCYLEVFSARETSQYVCSQFANMGGDASTVFSLDALERIYHATGGIPRVINQICDHALLLGYANGRAGLTGDDIDEAWADIQQLPVSWKPQREPINTRDESLPEVLEFAPLDGDLEGHDSEEIALPIKPSLAFEDSDIPLQGVPSRPERTSPLSAGIDDDSGELTSDFSLEALHDSFEEEELIVNRYAEFDSQMIAAKISTSSQESQWLSNMLLPIFSQSEPAELDQDPVMPELDAAPEPIRLGRNSSREISVSAQSFAGESDDDQIIVEQDPPVSLSGIKIRPMATVRRQEYQNLFTKLRRG